MFDWICALTADCVTGHSDKPKPKHSIEVPMEYWQNDTLSFCTIHIERKGTLHSSNNRNRRCMLVNDSYLRLNMVYPGTNANAQATKPAIEKWTTLLGNPSLFYMTEALLLLIRTSLIRQRLVGLYYEHEQITCRRKMAKLNRKINRSLNIGELFLNDVGNNWSQLAQLDAFAHNTSMDYTIGKLPNEIVFRKNHRYLCH